MNLKHRGGGQIEAVDSDAGMYLAAGWEVVQPPVNLDPPTSSATKQEWIDYARSCGFRDLDVVGKTKADLMAAIAALDVS